MQIITRNGAGESISAVPLGHGTRSRSYQRGRVCNVAGCSTVLSMYNPSVLCSIHGSRSHTTV
jgi:hypothetical protein